MRSARPSCSTGFRPRSSASSLLISRSRGSMQTCGSRTRSRQSVRGGETWFVVGRLRPTVTFDQAQAEMSAIARRLNDQLPAAERNRGISVVPLSLYMVGPAIATGIVDARRRGVLRVPDRRCQRHQPLAGAQHRSRARDGRSRCARSECRTDRATAAHRKRPARRRLGTDWHTARLGRHSTSSVPSALATCRV